MNNRNRMGGESPHGFPFPGGGVPLPGQQDRAMMESHIKQIKMQLTTQLYAGLLAEEYRHAISAPDGEGRIDLGRPLHFADQAAILVLEKHGLVRVQRPPAEGQGPDPGPVKAD